MSSFYSFGVVYAAGRNSRFDTQRLFGVKHKSLLTIGQRKLIDYQLKILFDYASVPQVIVVYSRNSEALYQYLKSLGDSRIILIENVWPNGSNMMSLWAARSLLGGRSFVMTTCDLYIDINPTQLFFQRPEHNKVLLTQSSALGSIDDDPVICALDSGEIVKITKDSGSITDKYYSPGIYAFSETFSETLFTRINHLVKQHTLRHPLYECLDEALLSSCPLHGIDCGDFHWVDIDTVGDYHHALGLDLFV